MWRCAGQRFWGRVMESPRMLVQGSEVGIATKGRSWDSPEPGIGGG